MVNGGQLVNEALNILSSFRNVIENKILSKSASLKPQVISISQKLVDISTMLFRLFESISKFVSNKEPGTSVVPSTWWSISIYSDRIVITRHKPIVVSVAYVKDEEKITFKTKYIKLELQRGIIKLQKRGLKLELDPSDLEDIARKLSDIKYVLRDVAGDLELLTYNAEKRFSK